MCACGSASGLYRAPLPRTFLFSDLSGAKRFTGERGDNELKRITDRLFAGVLIISDHFTFR